MNVTHVRLFVSWMIFAYNFFAMTWSPGEDCLVMNWKEEPVEFLWSWISSHVWQSLVFSTEQKDILELWLPIRFIWISWLKKGILCFSFLEPSRWEDTEDGKGFIDRGKSKSCWLPDLMKKGFFLQRAFNRESFLTGVFIAWIKVIPYETYLKWLLILETVHPSSLQQTIKTSFFSFLLLLF